MPNSYLPGVIQIPSMFLITAMTQSYPLSLNFMVPSTGSNSYIPGQLVRLTVPRPWGMYQANGLTAKILGINSTTMLLDLDSTNFDQFVDGSSSSVTPASLAPAGSRNLEFNNQTGQVAFQSLNDIGN
jgi:hypothetical protein